MLLFQSPGGTNRKKSKGSADTNFFSHLCWCPSHPSHPSWPSAPWALTGCTPFQYQSTADFLWVMTPLGVIR